MCGQLAEVWCVTNIQWKHRAWGSERNSNKIDPWGHRQRAPPHKPTGYPPERLRSVPEGAEGPERGLQSEIPTASLASATSAQLASGPGMG